VKDGVLVLFAFGSDEFFTAFDGFIEKEREGAATAMGALDVLDVKENAWEGLKPNPGWATDQAGSRLADDG